MTTKEEALKLADELDALHQYVPSEAPAMIRRLVEELGKTERKYKDKRKEIDGVFDYYCDENIRSKQTKPLSDEEITAIWQTDECYQKAQVFARAIEERHGIK